MLLSFSVRNYGPFRDEAILEMIPCKGDDLPDNAVPCAQTETSILTSAILFGPNSSGKSSLFRAVGDLKNLVSQVPPPNAPIPCYNPFRLSKATRNAPTEMSIRFSTDEALYEYSISFDSSSIVSEALYESHCNRRSKVFVRRGQVVSFTDSREKELRRIAEMAASNVPLLTLAAQFCNRTCMLVLRRLTDMIVCTSDVSVETIHQILWEVSVDPWMREHMVKALRMVDFGITDIAGEAPPVNQSGVQATFRMDLEHDFPGLDVDEVSRYLPYTIESSGTLQMLCTMAPVLRALRGGGVVFIDGFASSLHNSIARWIVEQFQAPNNPNGAQLIVNTHDLLLMDAVSLFRRDQIWFTDRDDSSGGAVLYCLSDFVGVRKDMDVLKSYIDGRFDAMPFIDRGDLLRVSQTFHGDVSNMPLTSSSPRE